MSDRSTPPRNREPQAPAPNVYLEDFSEAVHLPPHAVTGLSPAGRFRIRYQCRSFDRVGTHDGLPAYRRV